LIAVHNGYPTTSGRTENGANKRAKVGGYLKRSYLGIMDIEIFLGNQVVKGLFKDDVIVVVAIKSAVCK
jgi:hypothetical protein